MSDGDTISIATNTELRYPWCAVSGIERAYTHQLGITVIDRQGRHLISTRMTSISVCYLNVRWIKLRRLRKSFVLLPPCRRCFAVIVPPPAAPSRRKKRRKLPLDGDKAALGLIEIEKCKELAASSLVVLAFLPLRIRQRIVSLWTVTVRILKQSLCHDLNNSQSLGR